MKPENLNKAYDLTARLKKKHRNERRKKFLFFSAVFLCAIEKREVKLHEKKNQGNTDDRCGRVCIVVVVDFCLYHAPRRCKCHRKMPSSPFLLLLDFSLDSLVFSLRSV